MLKVDNIDVYYGAIHAIKGISIEVPKGEIVTLVGSNGSRQKHNAEDYFRADETEKRHDLV